ncbi:GroES-like protein [Glarea lozoyensis ATCC 20868]|uniref:GroES-like protein n=1 Tax=Glarea lozoyensis (strain ATCC 20868 / MF5171) TaxID=1116229 RepID=S3DAX5_GLAL2|nr:GroES-like protein [Glarea lozoyensis ATCC 20868]EPE29136.1 GroES-like protein [Glarea lozoyensis ATCC 20868]
MVRQDCRVHIHTASANDKKTSEVKASVLHGVKDLKIESRQLESPKPTEVQIAVQATGLCGSDLHYFNHYRNGDIIVREPLTLGHESSGIVTEVGSSVKDLQVGDKVALEVGLPCLGCNLCKEGRYNICKDLRFRSSAKSFPHFQGTLQERINHPAVYCHKQVLPTSTIGAILEPLGVAIHGSRRAGLKPGSTVLVFGAGAVGLLCAAMCKVSGAKQVIIADIQSDRVDFAVKNKFADAQIVVPMKRPQAIEEKLAFAKEVAEIVKSKSDIGDVDAVFECTGVESCLQAAIYSTRPGGRIMLIGMGSPIQTLPISAAALREVDLVGVFRYADTYKEAIKLVSSGNPLLPDLSKLITQRFKGFDKIPGAFDMAGRVKDDDGNLVLKVLVDTEQA